MGAILSACGSEIERKYAYARMYSSVVVDMLEPHARILQGLQYRADASVGCVLCISRIYIHCNRVSRSSYRLYVVIESYTYFVNFVYFVLWRMVVGRPSWS